MVWFIGISASCQFKILNNFRLSEMLCLLRGNLSERGGEKVLLENLDFWDGQVTNRLAPQVCYYFLPFNPSSQSPDTEREGEREGEARNNSLECMNNSYDIY